MIFMNWQVFDHVDAEALPEDAERFLPSYTAARLCVNNNVIVITTRGCTECKNILSQYILITMARPKVVFSPVLSGLALNSRTICVRFVIVVVNLFVMIC